MDQDQAVRLLGNKRKTQTTSLEKFATTHLVICGQKYICNIHIQVNPGQLFSYGGNFLLFFATT